jgi:very-short-patch-repair endonuclease
VCNYERQKELESYGVHIVGFLDSDIKNNIGGVIQCIEEWIDEFEKRNDL